MLSWLEPWGHLDIFLKKMTGISFFTKKDTKLKNKHKQLIKIRIIFDGPYFS